MFGKTGDAAIAVLYPKLSTNCLFHPAKVLEDIPILREWVKKQQSWWVRYNYNSWLNYYEKEAKNRIKALKEEVIQNEFIKTFPKP